MASPTVVLITGVSRGIGNMLVQTYLQRPNHIVIGSVRNLASPGVAELETAPKATDSKLRIVKIDSLLPEDPEIAINELKSAGIGHIDIVVANAVHNPPWEPLETVNFDDAIASFQGNALGLIGLFRTIKGLLEKSDKKPTWVSMTSIVGSIGSMESVGTHRGPSYGMAKAAQNWFTVSAHCGNPWLISFAAHPGLVQTDPGNAAARKHGMEKAPVTREQCAENIMSKIDKATREDTSGKCWDVSLDVELPW